MPCSNPPKTIEGFNKGGCNSEGSGISKRFRAACKDYRLSQEFVTPYTPEQNGMIERFFRSLKEECVWLRNVDNFEQARAAVAGWSRFYNAERPHQSQNYMNPEQFPAQQHQQVA